MIQVGEADTMFGRQRETEKPTLRSRRRRRRYLHNLSICRFKRQSKSKITKIKEKKKAREILEAGKEGRKNTR